MIVGDGDGVNLDLGAELGDGRKDRGALGAVGHSVRRVFDIASGEDLAFRSEDGRADSKVGKRRVGVLHYFARGTEQAFARGSRDLCRFHSQINVVANQVGNCNA